MWQLEDHLVDAGFDECRHAVHDLVGRADEDAVRCA
jgi:hypothetical protein